MSNRKDQTEIRWKDYKIIADEDCLALYTVHIVKEGKTKGEERYKEKGYFSEPERLVKHMAKLETLRKHDTCTLEEFILSMRDEAKNIVKHIAVMA